MSASASEFEEAGFLGTRQQRSRSKAVALFSFEGTFIPSVVLCLRLLAGSRMLDSSAQGSKEADSRQSPCSVLREYYSFLRCVASVSTSRIEEVRFLGTKLQRSKLKVVASFLEN